MKNSHELKNMLVDMLSWFHDFCVENGLRYYVVGGTMLGAVRHKGFIPWDDDVDVAMPGEDYKKLERLLASKNGRYILETPNTSAKDYFYTFSKLYDTQTTLTENTKYKIKRGIYIDIFPMYGMGNSKEESEATFKKIEKINNLLISKITGIRKGRSLIKNLIVFAFRFIPLNEKKLLKRVVDVYSEKSWDDCSWGGNPVGAWRLKEIMPKEIMGEPTLYDFEGIKVYGAQNADQYLTYLYGDWRQLPPEEKRVTHHDYIYCNLHRSYTEKSEYCEDENIMKSFEILCATMYQTDFTKIDKMNIHSNVVFANQTDCYGYEEKEFEDKKARLISTSTRGVGVNRNLALLHSNADIVLFADDDLIYSDNLEENVLKAFSDNPSADVVIFSNKFQKNGEIYQTRVLKDERLPVYKALKFGTYLIAAKKEALLKHNITFSNLFGGGCIYSHGEDSDFILQCFKNKLKVYTSSFMMCTTIKDTSSWFTGYDEKYFYDTGALARNSFGKLAYAYMLYMAFRIKTDEFSFIDKMKQMKKGYKGFKTLTPYKEEK